MSLVSKLPRYVPGLLAVILSIAASSGARAQTVVSGPATGISATGATLNGTVNPDGLTTSALFEYGLTSAYGTQAEVALAPDNGATEQSVSKAISGLLPATAYHYRLSAAHGGATSVGADMTFST